MIRFVMSCTAAAMLLAAPVSASAAPKKAMHSTHKPAKHMASKKSARMASARPAQGSAAVDALNEQSLARARSGQ